ncbi:MAG: hypothetical protein QW470_00270 [Candidatus Caldarchaeum sp.]
MKMIQLAPCAVVIVLDASLREPLDYLILFITQYKHCILLMLAFSVSYFITATWLPKIGQPEISVTTSASQFSPFAPRTL